MSKPDKRILTVTLTAMGSTDRLKFTLECGPNIQVIKGQLFDITAPDCRPVHTRLTKVVSRSDGTIEVTMRALFRLHGFSNVEERLRRMAALEASNVKELRVCPSL